MLTEHELLQIQELLNEKADNLGNQAGIPRRALSPQEKLFCVTDVLGVLLKWTDVKVETHKAVAALIRAGMV